MQSEKRRKKLKCFEARIDSGDELPFNPDRTRLSIPGKGKFPNQLYCHVLKRADSPEEETVSIKEPKSKKLQ